MLSSIVLILRKCRHVNFNMAGEMTRLKGYGGMAAATKRRKRDSAKQ